MNTSTNSPKASREAVFSLTRPEPSLLRYYFLCSLIAGPFFPIALVPLYFKFRTLRYSFDENGISMRWGILFRKEVLIQYARIQDIHLTSNAVERWLGLARIEIQTASGSSDAEMTLEGIRNFEGVRDFLYEQMRGVKEEKVAKRREEGGETERGGEGATTGDPVSDVLRQVVEELRGIREEIGRRRVN